MSNFCAEGAFAYGEEYRNLSENLFAFSDDGTENQHQLFGLLEEDVLGPFEFFVIETV